MKRTSNPSRLTRRRFVQTTGMATAFTIVPRVVLGGTENVAPSGRVNIGYIGAGSQGLRVMLGFLKHPDVQIVSVNRRRCSRC